VLETFRLALDCDRCELDYELRAWIGDRKEHPADSADGNVQLLGEFSARCVFVRLTRLQLTTGKLPETAVSLMRWSLTNQESVFALDDSRENAL
jgi:hypothetical protein